MKINWLVILGLIISIAGNISACPCDDAVALLFSPSLKEETLKKSTYNEIVLTAENKDYYMRRTALLWQNSCVKQALSGRG